MTQLRLLEPGETFLTSYTDRAAISIASNAGIKVSTRTRLLVDDAGRGKESATRVTLVTRE